MKVVMSFEVETTDPGSSRDSIQRILQAAMHDPDLEVTIEGPADSEGVMVVGVRKFGEKDDSYLLEVADHDPYRSSS